MRWLCDRSNNAREEIATTSLSDSVALGMRHPSAQPPSWLWRCAENPAQRRSRSAPDGEAARWLRGATHAVAEFGEHGAHLFDPPVDFRPCDYQWRSEAHDGAVRILG